MNTESFSYRDSITVLIQGDVNQGERRQGKNLVTNNL